MGIEIVEILKSLTPISGLILTILFVAWRWGFFKDAFSRRTVLGVVAGGFASIWVFLAITLTFEGKEGYIVYIIVAIVMVTAVMLIPCWKPTTE